MGRIFVPGGGYIVLEGIDGCGKDTQIELLMDKLKLAGYDTHVVREPGTTPIAEQVRGILLHPPVMPGKGRRRPEKMDALSQLCGFSFARRQTLVHVIRPFIKRGAVALAGRSWLSSLVYQGYGGGLDLELARALSKAVMEGCVPDRIFVLDLSVGEAKERLKARALSAPEELNSFDSKPIEFFETLRAGYLEEARRNPDLIEVIDAARSPQYIFEELAEKTLGLLQRKRTRPKRS